MAAFRAPTAGCRVGTVEVEVCRCLGVWFCLSQVRLEGRVFLVHFQAAKQAAEPMGLPVSESSVGPGLEGDLGMGFGLGDWMALASHRPQKI